MQERSVTRAGRRLGMSQPALSHALNRLRYLLKDQLFIRTPKGMAPTPRAEQLALPLRKALADMERALEPEAFVPAEASRRFSIAVNNYAAIVLAAPLVAVMRRTHPTGHRPLSTAAFGALRHAAISSSGDDTGFIDRSLATHGTKRQIELRLPYLSAG